MKKALKGILILLLSSGPIHALTDSLWIAGGEGNPGDLVTVEVWLQYEGSGVGDSMTAFDVPLTWDASVCTAEAVTVGSDFGDWDDRSRIDNQGVQGPPAVPKMGISAFTLYPLYGPPAVPRGTYLAATVDFRILNTAVPLDSSCSDTLMQAFTDPSISLGFADKHGTTTYIPSFSSDCVRLRGPHVLSTLPSQNQLNAPVSTNISVTFNFDMDGTTINDSTFVVHAKSTGLHRGVITYDTHARKATLDPLSDFAVGEVVTVSLTTGIHSEEGITLEESHVWSFTIEVPEGTGVFAPEVGYPIDDFLPVSIFAADLDGDGDIDLCTANPRYDGVSVLLNHGDGTFAGASVHPVDLNPRQVSAADLDQDDDLDLVVACYAKLNVLMNRGDAEFDPALACTVGGSPQSFSCSDLDGDGDLDLAVGIYGFRLRVMLNDGHGTFTLGPDYPLPHYPEDLVAGDLDGSGDLDLVVANVNVTPPFDSTVAVVLNDGNGAFGPYSIYGVGTAPYSVVAADLDRDGDLDLTTANDMSFDVSVLLNEGDGTFAAHLVYPVGMHPYSVICGDLLGNGHLDLAVANFISGDISVLFNEGDGEFSRRWDYLVGPCPISLVAADLDGDDDLDLVAADYCSDVVSVLMNMGPSTCGDCNGDGRITVADGNYIVSYIYRNGLGPVGDGDANQDGRVTVADAMYLVAYIYRAGPEPCNP